MQEKLVIYLHAHDLARPSWAVLDDAQHVRQSSPYDSPDGLAQMADDKEVIVIVPAEDVLFITTVLPKMNHSRLLQAVPFAVEEQLVEDVNQLHFAVGDYQANGQLAIAIVAHEKMQQWTALLKSWSVKPDRMIAGFHALPSEQHTWHILLNELAIVRAARLQGFACDSVNLPHMLAQALEAAEEKPQQIEIHNYTSHAFKTALGVQQTVNEHFMQPEQFIANQAKHAQHAPAVNLLQGLYTVKKNRLPGLNHVLKIASYLAVAWVALLVLYPTVSYLLLNQRVSAIDAQIARIYKSNFPEASSVVAPKLRMEEKLTKLSARVGENRLLFLLGFVGKGILQTPSVSLKRFDFQNNQLTLELTAASSDDFSAFADYLTQQGLKVKQQNANLNGSRINATLQIE